MSFSSKISATFSRPADNTAYAAGDHIANSGTAASVVPLTFPLTRRTGRLFGGRAIVAPASSNLVITALDFDLLLFRGEASIPFAAANYPADNAALTVTAAMQRELVGVLSFVNSAWRNPAGALTAGTSGYQHVKFGVATSVGFNVGGLSDSLIGIVQAVGAWTPTGVINRFDFNLDVDYD